jgi:hypothetical protein
MQFGVARKRHAGRNEVHDADILIPAVLERQIVKSRT